MKLTLFDYRLPQALIANEPASPRDHSRVLIYDKNNDSVIHEKFYNIHKFLRKGDLLIFNNSKVMAARLYGGKTTGGKIEILLLKDFEKGKWEAMIKGKNLKPEQILHFKVGLTAQLISKSSEKTWLLQFNFKGKKLNEIIEKYGQVPIPPYIQSQLTQSKLKTKYNTVYAKHSGSSAAPTAGLHFTPGLMKKIESVGVQSEYITLHVGMGTFESVMTEDIQDHSMHSEHVIVDLSTIKAIQSALKRQKAGEDVRIISVGTTTTRTLEALGSELFKAKKKIEKDVNIFIYPGYKFKIVDAMFTNFHLPKSTLLMLISALIGREKVMVLYKLAIKLKYRFYSFGDSMFLITK